MLIPLENSQNRPNIVFLKTFTEVGINRLIHDGKRFSTGITHISGKTLPLSVGPGKYIFVYKFHYGTYPYIPPGSKDDSGMQGRIG
jgi:hypothetical protein